MSNENPLKNIDFVPSIKVGYFEKEEYLKIIDRQEKQIKSFADQIMALQAKISALEENQFCSNCGADMRVKKHKLGYKVINRGKCMLCGKELNEGIFFCKECEKRGEEK